MNVHSHIITIIIIIIIIIILMHFFIHSFTHSFMFKILSAIEKVLNSLRKFTKNTHTMSRYYYCLQ